MDSTPMPASLRTVLVAVAAVLALVGVTGIATGAAKDDGDDAATAAGRTSTTLSTSESTLGGGDGEVTTTIPGVTTTAGKGSTATTKPTGSTGTTVVSSESNACTAPAGTSAPADSQAPAVGIYSYVNCTPGGQGVDSKVEPGSGTDGKTRRRVTASFQGNSVTQIRSYTGGNVTLEGLDIVSPYGTIHCDVNPDVVETPAGLTNGKTWSGSGSCDQPPPVGKITFSGSGKVTGAKTVTIGGTTVPVWVIETQITVTAAGQSQKTNGVSYYDPSRGLDLYQETTVNGQKVSLRIASLTPRAA